MENWSTYSPEAIKVIDAYIESQRALAEEQWTPVVNDRTKRNEEKEADYQRQADEALEEISNI